MQTTERSLASGLHDGAREESRVDKLIERAQQVLKQYFGFEEFRPFQEALIEQVLDGRDVLGVMPTGAGKSLVYQVPALVFDGIAIVVSPLISLMKDQVDALQQAGVAAACLNSSLSPYEQSDLIAQAATGCFRILYVAPERLADQRFRNLCERIDVSLVAVDEAHCVSQWGKDFRPSYVQIATFVESLPVRPRVCALTATATDEVRKDIAASLRLSNPYLCVAGFDRKNLYFGVERPIPAKKDACLLELIRERKGRSGIVYCSTRNAVDEVCVLLQAEGYAAAPYHAGLGDAERKRNQEDFLRDVKTIIVATNAFGMGIDKSNVGFVIHYNMPGDIESYYQEAGRAGRDGSSADCILIYNKSDVQTVGFFADCNHEDRLAQGMDPSLSATLLQRDQERIRRMTIYCTTADCLRSFFLRYFGETDAPFRCENCSSCNAVSETVDATTEALKLISCVLRLRQRGRSVGRSMIIDILRGSKAQKVLDSGFDTLSTYGIMQEVPKDLMHTLLDALIAESYLQVAVGKFPVISCTEKGRDFITQKESFSLKIAKAKLDRIEDDGQDESARDSRSGRKSRLAPQTVDGLDEDSAELFEKLKAVRSILAREQNVPAYIVFHDATLIDMCMKRPQDIDEFLEVSGVGQKKAERYAQDFIDCIDKHLGQCRGSG